MRSRSTLLRTRRIPLSLDARHALTFSSSSAGRFPRNLGSSRFSENLRTQQLSSSASTPPDDDTPTFDAIVEEKPKRRAVRSSTKASEKENAESSASSVQRADIQEILWQPHDPLPAAPSSPGGSPYDSSLPEPWLLQDAYETLLLALHPQTQHRATYPGPSNAGLVEPTLGFYCPMEGGDYVVDATVRSLARRAKADVVVIDAVELSAGEHGRYGKAASVFQFSEHPLHAPSASVPPPPRSRQPSSARDEDADDDESNGSFFMGAPAAFTIQIPNGGPGTSLVRSSRSGSGVISPLPRGAAAPTQRLKAFFDDLLNLTSTFPHTTEKDSEALRRPRIVYVRNYPHIADHVPSWFPGLQAAVRARRQGPLPRPTSPVTGPTVIILGSSPPIRGDTSSRPSASPSSSIFSLLAAASGSRPPPAPKVPIVESSWNETDRKSRERRLKERLRKWQKGHEGLLDEMPVFSPGSSSPMSIGRRLSGMKEVSLGSNVVAIPLGASWPENSNNDPFPSANPGYFRVVGLVPRLRDEQLERYGRMTYRLKCNALALKLAVSEAGGVLVGQPEASVEAVAKLLATPPPADGAEADIPDADTSSQAKEPAGDDLLSFVDSCLLTIKPWRELKAVADAVVGAALSTSASERGLQAHDPSIEPTTVTWDQVSRSVESSAESSSLRNAWIQSLGSGKDVEDGATSENTVDGASVPEVDEVLEAVRKDPDLDQHEQRLLGCIVDPATMPTAFKSVHLPPATIDAVRTMVSLPLLFPHAFSTGILKTHAMEGALLFGPPGTGKTLLARAIARESGARMMIIKPSDVMDMYVGEGEKLVRSVFTLARRLSPAVVFIDEIDALFGARVSNRDSGGTMAHRGIITEFMQEMDGLKSSRDQTVVVIGATNRPFDLDDAVLRRLPRRILIDLPGPKEREEILKILLRDEKLGDDVDLQALGIRTESFSGSDLKHLCIAAALDAVKETVDVPWTVPTKVSTSPSEVIAEATKQDAIKVSSKTEAPEDVEPLTTQPPTSTPPTRVLGARHFAKALHEITPSASESLGTLSSLRKWNDEFGEGAAGKAKKRRGWGDKFGFGTPKDAKLLVTPTIEPTGPSPSI